MKLIPKNTRLLSLSATLLGLSLLTGCYRHTITVGAGGNTEQEAAYAGWEHHALYGLLLTSEVDVKSACPSGNATIDAKTSFLNGLVSGVTFGLYTPTTINIYCDAAAPAAPATTPEEKPADGASASLEKKVTHVEVSASTMARLAHDPAILAWAKHEDQALGARLEAALRNEKTGVVASR